MAIFIAVSGWMSKWKPVMSSVPQGPILGPLLFNVFISDMDRGIECTLSKTAEGTKLTTAIETPVQRVPSRGILTGLRSGPMWASWNSTRVSARPCTWVGAIPNVSTDCGMDGLRAALQRTWGYWWLKNCVWSGNVHLQTRKPLWDASKEASSSREIFLSALLIPYLELLYPYLGSRYKTWTC